MKKYDKPMVDCYQVFITDVVLSSNFELVETNKIGEGEGEVW